MGHGCWTPCAVRSWRAGIACQGACRPTHKVGPTTQGPLENSDITEEVRAAATKMVEILDVSCSQRCDAEEEPHDVQAAAWPGKAWAVESANNVPEILGYLQDERLALVKGLGQQMP